MTRGQLNLLRLYLDKTQKQFAEEIGVSEPTIAKIEAGYAEISTTTKAKVLRKYDLSDDGFLDFCRRMGETWERR
jgi:transcriptional regulator with XRE-family HTH domain